MSCARWSGHAWSLSPLVWFAWWANAGICALSRSWESWSSEMAKFVPRKHLLWIIIARNSKTRNCGVSTFLVNNCYFCWQNKHLISWHVISQITFLCKMALGKLSAEQHDNKNCGNLHPILNCSTKSSLVKICNQLSQLWQSSALETAYRMKVVNGCQCLLLL